eukprot:101978-Prymnesium_polylepis.1
MPAMRGRWGVDRGRGVRRRVVWIVGAACGSRLDRDRFPVRALELIASWRARSCGVVWVAGGGAHLLGVKVHLVANRAPLRPRVHPPLTAHNLVGRAGERQQMGAQVLDRIARRLRDVVPEG